MVVSKKIQLSHIAGALALLLAALLYLLTLDNGLRPDELVGGDLITHQYAQVQGRPSNAPGYPLYTMGGWLWFHLGRTVLSRVFNPIQILSLYSTLWGLASLLMLYLILLKATGRRWPVAFLLTLFYAATFFFWYYSVTTEQYTSAVFQTLLLIWLALRWDEQSRDRTLLWLVVVSSTMLANMVTTLFILPPLLWFIFFRRDPSEERYFWAVYLKQPKLVFQAIGLALLPLLSYSYVYSRGAQHPEWRGQGAWTTTWQWFVQFLTIQQGRDELGPGLTLQHFFTAEFPALMWHELTWPVLLGGLLGLACLGRRRAIWLYTTLLIYFLFCWGYRFGNWFQVIIPAYPIFIIGLAAGINFILSSINKNGPLSPPRFAFYAINLVLIGLVLYRFTASLPRANQRNRPDDTGLEPGWAILADQPVRPALVSGVFGERVALDYLRIVWGAADGVYATAAGDFTLPDAAAVDDLAIYMTRQAVAAAPDAIRLETVYPQAAGEQLIALWSTPRTELPPSAIPLHLDFGDKLELIGWEQIDAANWQIALYWRAIAPMSDDYTMSVRPLVGGAVLTSEGEAVIQDHQPVWGVYPTSRWRSGELVRDVYALSLPPATSPEAIRVVVYRATESGFENLAEQTLVIRAGE